MNLTKKTKLTLFCLIISAIQILGQGIKGTVKDENGNPIAFSSIYIHETSKGAITGNEGEYEINMDIGEYKISFHSIGYQTETKNIIIQGEWLILDVTLPSMRYEISEVIVNKSGRDPAYSIMRKAIAMAPYYKNQVLHYESKLYVKGNMIVDKLAKFISKRIEVSSGDTKLDIKGGDHYIMETYSILNYTAPGNYDEKVISSQSSFPMASDDGALGYMAASLYDPKIENVVSPLSPQAFSYYKFRYEGVTFSGKYAINKIQVTPRRKGRQVYEGYIYIVDGLWCLHSVELSTNTVVGDITFKQIFENVNDEAWLPISHDLRLTLSFPGIKSRVRYAASIKYESVNINQDLPVPAIITAFKDKKDDNVVMNTELEDKENEEMQELFEKDELKKRDMLKMVKYLKNEAAIKDTIKGEASVPQENYHQEKDTTFRDSIDWKKIRPVPLDQEELISYQINDSLKSDSSSVNDSTETDKKKDGKKSAFSQIISGKKDIVKNDTIHFTYNGLINPKNFGFNTVDGFYINQRFTYNHKIDSIHKLEINPTVGYAINRETIQWEVPFLYKYGPHFSHGLLFKIGSNSRDFKDELGYHRFLNMASSLFFRENPVKLYQDNYVMIRNQSKWWNSVSSDITIKYSEIEYIENHSDYSLFLQDSKEYSSNIPGNNLYDTLLHSSHESFTLNTEFRYSLPFSHSNFKPTEIGIKYKKGFKDIFGSDVSFDYVELNILQHLHTGLFTEMSFSVSAGAFLNNSKVYFNDFKHFKSSELPVTSNNFNSIFLLQNEYTLSNNKHYISGHYHIKTPYMALKYLPWINSRLWKENLYVNYISTSHIKNYWEVGYALTDVFLLFDIGVFAGFTENKYEKTALRLNLEF